jgi:hypothetical protein
LKKLEREIIAFEKKSTRTDLKTKRARIIVTLDTTIGSDKLIHVQKAAYVFYSFIYRHEN